MQFLKSYELFRELTNTALTSLSYGMVERTYYKYQDVYREGMDQLDCIYFVKHGTFKCTRRFPKVFELPLELNQIDLDDPENREKIKDLSRIR